MNNAFSCKPGSKLQPAGRGFAIAVVVIFSSLSFTLGYFVGKSGQEKASVNPVELTESTLPPEVKKPEQSVAPEPQFAIEEAGESVKTEEIKPLAEASSVIIKEMQPGPEKNQQLPSGEEKISAPQPGIKENNRKQIPKSSSAVAKERDSDGPIYTVQIGAFRSSADAEAFRKKIEKKGFKTFITTAMNKDNEKVYKLKTGNFRDRKSAEILSLKLNKKEELKTFVTLKNT